MKKSPTRPNARAVPAKKKGRSYGAAKRWNLNHASREFGAHRDVMDKQRRALHIEPGEDGQFSTRQICAMVFGDKQLADTQRAQAEAEAAQRKNARESGELIPVAVAVALSAQIDVIIRQQICASSMPDAEKDSILETIERAKDLDWGKAAREASK